MTEDEAAEQEAERQYQLDDAADFLLRNEPPIEAIERIIVMSRKRIVARVTCEEPF